MDYYYIKTSKLRHGGTKNFIFGPMPNITYISCSVWLFCNTIAIHLLKKKNSCDHISLNTYKSLLRTGSMSRPNLSCDENIIINLIPLQWIIFSGTKLLEPEIMVIKISRAFTDKV
jgi:hypothetical protein